MYLRLTVTLTLFVATAASAPAQTSVLTNQTEKVVRFRVSLAKGSLTERSLDPGNSTSIRIVEPTQILWKQTGATRRLQMSANESYEFITDGVGIQCRRVVSHTPLRADYFVPVKIAVDEEEPAHASKWSQRLRNRVQQASRVFEANFGIGFKVVAEDRWQSDNSAETFDALVRDFERKVNAGSARLAIGFSSQRLDGATKPRLGGTRGPLASHIMIHETRRLTSARARVEVLIHELGHFLGAVHSPDTKSVMRIRLGDGQVNARKFHITFDPVNTLIIYSVTQELKTGRVQRMSDLSANTKRFLRGVYTDISRQMPDDETAARYAQFVDVAVAVPSDAASQSPTVRVARIAVAAIVRAAEEDAGRPDGMSDLGARQIAASDSRTEYYVRRAAKAVLENPSAEVKGLLLGLGVAFDDSSLLRGNPLTRGLWTAVETDEERTQRLRVMKTATMAGRRDLAQHFFVSAALTACYGALAAEAAGVQKEVLDANGGSGFSFVDLLADFSGIAFARQVLAAESPRDSIVTRFRIADVLPDISNWPEGLSRKEFEKRFGSVLDSRYREQVARIRQAILMLQRKQER